MKNVKILTSYDDVDGTIVADVYDGLLVSDRYSLIYDGLVVSFDMVKPVYGHKGVYSSEQELFNLEVGEGFEIESLHNTSLPEFLICLANMRIDVKSTNA
jgi:hypothetical protein